MSRYTELNLFPALFMLIGFGLLIAGVAYIYRPAALITAGVLLTAFGFFGRRGAL
jgi:uncharacterized membrane-anchored protein YitT (DUF2179 family)